jgi:hypothetical protein
MAATSCDLHKVKRQQIRNPRKFWRWFNNVVTPKAIIQKKFHKVGCESKEFKYGIYTSGDCALGELLSWKLQ